MTVYITLWTILTTITVSDQLLVIILSEGQVDEKWVGEDLRMYRIIISATTLIGVRYFVASCLDMLILLAYYRLSKKISYRVSKLVSQTLIEESIATQ